MLIYYAILDLLPRKHFEIFFLYWTVFMINEPNWGWHLESIIHYDNRPASHKVDGGMPLKHKSRR